MNEDRPSSSDWHLVRQHISISNLLTPSSILTLLFLRWWTRPCWSITNRRNVLQTHISATLSNKSHQIFFEKSPGGKWGRTLALYRVVVPTASTPFRIALVAK